MFARCGAYATFPEVAIISRLHLTTPVQRHSWQKLRQDPSTQKFYIMNVVSIFFNRNWPSIFYQDPTCINAGTYKVRNEIETKRNETKSTKTKRNEINKNETKSTKWKRNKTKPTKAKRNQRKQNEIENGRKNNRGLKEIKPIFTITMLDYFPHMSVFHQERTGFDHHWTRILCIYSAGVCPFHLVASFKFGNHKSNVKSVERRGIKITEVQ